MSWPAFLEKFQLLATEQDMFPGNLWMQDLSRYPIPTPEEYARLRLEHELQHQRARLRSDEERFYSELLQEVEGGSPSLSPAAPQATSSPPPPPPPPPRLKRKRPPDESGDKW